jgi:hypothetical protein
MSDPSGNPITPSTIGQVGTIVALTGHALRAPIHYEIRSDAPFNWVLYCAEFQLWGSGGSLYAAVTELASSLDAMFSDYSYTDDSMLGADAVRMKRRLLYLFGQRATDQ